MRSRNPSQTTFTLRIANTPLADSAGRAPTVDLLAAYRNSRTAAQQGMSSMRGMSIGIRSTGSTSYYRRAA